MRQFGIVITATVLFSLLAASQSHATLTPQLEWIRTYDSPNHDWDEANGVTVDSAGSVYVTGFSAGDIWIRKYDSKGDVVWTDMYGVTFGDDRGFDVAVDIEGNLYVTGYEFRGDLGQNTNVWLRKYDTNGNTLWTETYDSPAHSEDYGHGVTVDAAGNVYVTGYERRVDLDQNNNVWLRKYDTNGNTVWTETYDNPNHGGDHGYGVALDVYGCVYVTGNEHRTDLEQGTNILLLKHDTSGNVLWTRTYNSPGHLNDQGKGVVVDANGNVYVTGFESRPDLGQNSNVWLRKYDTNGNTLWTKTYNNPVYEWGWEVGRDVAVDTEGNVYIAGYESFPSSGHADIWLRKYDTDGNVLWTETYDSPAHSEDYGHGVAVDAVGNIYVVGREKRDDLGGINNHNIVLLKYSQPGYVVIPEPSTLLLLAPALLGFAGLLRKKPR